MKIISKIKDYYDSALGFGIEKDRLFFREQKDVLFSSFSDKEKSLEKCFEYLIKRNSRYNYYYLKDISKHLNIKIVNINEYLLFFCGKCYPLLRIEIEKNSKLFNKYFYNLDSFELFLKESVIEKEKFNKFWLKNNKNSIELTKEKFKSFFNIKIKESDEVFHYFNACYFLLSYNNSIFGKNIQNYKVNIYPELKSIDFQKIKNPYECLQEISQFLYGVLTSKENNIVEVEDKYKIEGHGFDLKESFRKRKKK